MAATRAAKAGKRAAARAARAAAPSPAVRVVVVWASDCSNGSAHSSSDRSEPCDARELVRVEAVERRGAVTSIRYVLFMNPCHMICSSM